MEAHIDPLRRPRWDRVHQRNGKGPNLPLVVPGRWVPFYFFTMGYFYIFIDSALVVGASRDDSRG